MICGKCGAEFDPEHFNQKLCGEECRLQLRREAKARYRSSPKGQASEARWIASDRRNENEKGYRQKPRARALAVKRARRCLANNPHLLDRKRERDKVYSATPKGRQINLEATRKYRKTVKGRATNKNSKARRRALEATGTVTHEQWQSRLQDYGFRCAYCGTAERLEQDHVVPLTKGGLHVIENIQPLCRTCNTKKSNKTGLQLLALIARIQTSMPSQT